MKETLASVKKKVKAMGDISEQQKKETVCMLVGHSRIQTTFFGYWYCGRCEQQLGDSLGSYYPFADSTVIVGHKCDKCVENYDKCTWKDTYLAPDPFKEEELATAQ